MITGRLPIIVIFAIVAGLLTSLVYASEANRQIIPTSVEAQLDAYIKQYIDRYEAEHCTDRDPGDTSTCRGAEYKKARRFCFGDINGDGKDDIAVLYTIESFCCGNNYQFYLAVFLSKGSKFELVASKPVGGKGERGVEFDLIKNGKILLNINEYLPGDPMCCPSGKGKTTYSLVNRNLIESDQTGEKPMSHIER